jgi:ABC-type transport system involved in multi-copper enzyme maturation permease subunit
MSGNSAFELVSECSWHRGLSNLLDKEFAGWWKTRMWWIQCLIWVGLIGFIVGAALFGSPNSKPVLSEMVVLYAIIAAIFPAAGVIIIMQDALVGDKREGTAAWILSKPAARQAFILSKLIAYSFGVLATMVVLPGIVVYAMISIGVKATPDPWLFMAALGIIFLSFLFYLTLTLMLGSFFKNRAPVIGIPMAILFLQQYLIGLLPALGYVLPWSLFVSTGNPNVAPIVPALLIGQPIYSYIPIVALAVESILFTLIAIWRFNREEF